MHTQLASNVALQIAISKCYSIDALKMKHTVFVAANEGITTFANSA